MDLEELKRDIESKRNEINDKLCNFEIIPLDIATFINNDVAKSIEDWQQWDP